MNNLEEILKQILDRVTSGGSLRRQGMDIKVPYPLREFSDDEIMVSDDMRFFSGRVTKLPSGLKLALVKSFELLLVKTFTVNK